MWRVIPNYTNYEVSDQGQVKRSACLNYRGKLRKERILKLNPAPAGYLITALSKAGKKKWMTVHSLVLKVFKGPRPEGQEARHLNGVKTDNRAENLEWGTIQENRLDQKRHGTGIQGKRNPKAKMSLEDVERVVFLRELGYSQQAIADQSGIHQTHVSKILSGRHYLLQPTST